jgi:NADPH:quinone reductase-like Zn-dependent oxidoreductase
MGKSMKAIVWTNYGSPDYLQLQEVAEPLPKENEILIRIHAATVTAADTELRGLKGSPLYTIPFRFYLGFRKPTRIKILGSEFAGEVITAGNEVSIYKSGDRVYGYTGLGMGTYAEYICLAEKPASLLGVMGIKPANLTYEEAAAVPFGGLEALHALRKANIQSGQKVLIIGAGGTIGTYAVQFAKLYGGEVTAVDQADKLDMLRSIGADHLIDYTREDFTKGGRAYDVIFDAPGKGSVSSSLRALKEDGTYLNANPGLFGGLRMRWASNGRSKKIIPWSGGYSASNLLALKELVEAGKIKPVIDRRYPLEQTAEAHRYVESGRKKGNVVIRVGEESGQ